MDAMIYLRILHDHARPVHPLFHACTHALGLENDFPPPLLPSNVCVCVFVFVYVCVCVRLGATRLLKSITIPVKLCMSAPVICVKTSDPASKAFDTISRRGISGLAVT